VTSPSPRQLRLGVLGCGTVFQRFHLPALARVPAIQLLAASDTDPNRERWARGLQTHTAQLGSLEELLHRGPKLDALLVLTPPQAHAEVVVTALEAGLHVLVEKPMALDIGEAARMVDAASRARRRLQVGFCRRFRAPYQLLRSMLGALAREQLREVRFELAFPTSTWKAQTDFLGNPVLGGGVFDDVLSHQVDLIRRMLGEPQEVRAVQEHPPDGPVRADFRLGNLLVRCDAAHARYAERIEAVLADGRVFEASGSRVRSSKASFPELRRRRALLQDRVALLRDRLLGRANVTLMSFEEQLRDFERAIRSGRSEGASAEDGLRAVEIVQACRASADEGGAWRKPEISARPAA
jgi:predicted dehydrogenase